MKNNDSFNLASSIDGMRSAYTRLLEGASKIIAILALLIAVLVSFTDVRFQDFSGSAFTSSLAVMLISSYLIYFSLEDAGEKLGESSDEYTAAMKKYREAKEKISPSEVVLLRDFLTEYSLSELKWRRSSFLAERGIPDDIQIHGAPLSKREQRALRQAERFKRINLTPRKLLCSDKSGKRSELEGPERAKLFSMLLRLLPSTVCTLFTVSVILTTKDGLSASAVAEAILKLSALPVIGFKGYIAGYEYARGAKCDWLETKARLLESFRASRKNTHDSPTKA